MSNLNKISLLFFIVAKFLGIFAVISGFVNHMLAGWLLLSAIVSVFISVILSFIQLGRDKESFGNDDVNLRKVNNLMAMQKELQDQIALLEEKRENLEKLQARFVK